MAVKNFCNAKPISMKMAKPTPKVGIYARLRLQFVTANCKKKSPQTICDIKTE